MPGGGLQRGGGRHAGDHPAQAGQRQPLLPHPAPRPEGQRPHQPEGQGQGEGVPQAVWRGQVQDAQQQIQRRAGDGEQHPIRVEGLQGEPRLGQQAAGPGRAGHGQVEQRADDHRADRDAPPQEAPPPVVGLRRVEDGLRQQQHTGQQDDLRAGQHGQRPQQRGQAHAAGLEGPQRPGDQREQQAGLHAAQVGPGHPAAAAEDHAGQQPGAPRREVRRRAVIQRAAPGVQRLDRPAGQVGQQGRRQRIEKQPQPDQNLRHGRPADAQGEAARQQQQVEQAGGPG